MVFYDIDKIIHDASQPGVDISPADRQEWVMFCCALKVLGYDLNTFVAMSNTTREECTKVWKNEKNPGRYIDTDRAIAKIIALAKVAGIDIERYRLTEAKNQADQADIITMQNAINQEPNEPPVYITAGDVERLQREAKGSRLYKYLCSIFDSADVDLAFARYRIGATDEFKPVEAGTAFPYINATGQCVDVKLMKYDSAGHRDKGNYSQNWLLYKRKQSERRASWCLFGEHLIAGSTKPVAVVESEKSALIASIAAPVFTWVAVGSMQNLKPGRCTALAGRDVYLFPDADGVASWVDNGFQLAAKGFKVFFCSDYITRHATGAKDDVADIIINHITQQHEKQRNML